MRYKFCIFFILVNLNLFGQEKFTFVTDSIKTEFVISNNGKRLIENIKVQNLSTKSIFIPIIDNKEFYFFLLNERLHSYLGIMSSITGAPNLSGQIELAKIEPNDSLNLTAEINENGLIKFYSFGLDFMTEDDKSLIIFRDNKLLIKVSDYVNVYRGLYHKQN